MQLWNPQGVYNHLLPKLAELGVLSPAGILPLPLNLEADTKALICISSTHLFFPPYKVTAAMLSWTYWSGRSSHHCQEDFFPLTPPPDFSWELKIYLEVIIQCKIEMNLVAVVGHLDLTGHF